ncbi:MAG: hypothetical protein RBT65_18820 [Methanolobus sp.]|nr:hypothetical protein [Methanolobus sp.]
MAVTTQQTAELSPINITVVNAQNIGIRVVYNVWQYEKYGNAAPTLIREKK